LTRPAATRAADAHCPHRPAAGVAFGEVQRVIGCLAVDESGFNAFHSCARADMPWRPAPALRAK